MNAITYTFPANFPVPALRNVTATGGRLTCVNQSGRRVEAVEFAAPIIQGHKITAIVAGKPGLELAVAAYRAEQARAKAEAEADAERFAATLEGQRMALVEREYNLYSPENFPGSRRWVEHQAAQRALAAFDAAHPHIAAAAAAEAAAKQQARIDGMSEFARYGN